MTNGTATINGVHREIVQIVATNNGIYREVTDIPVTLNGVYHEGYVAFDPSLPTYSADLYYPAFEGRNIYLIEFCTLTHLKEAVNAGYTQMEFTLSIDNSASTQRYTNDYLAICVPQRNYTVAQVMNPTPTGSDTQNFTITLSTVIATMEQYSMTALWLMLNPNMGAHDSCDRLAVSLSNSKFIR